MRPQIQIMMKLRGGAERGVEMETQGDDFVNVGEFKVIAGNEFGRTLCPQYEQLTCLDCIQLETAGTETGLKNLVVASTIVDRGEDHSARGAVRFVPLLRYLKAYCRFRGLCLWGSGGGFRKEFADSN